MSKIILTYGNELDDDQLNITSNVLPGRLQITIELTKFSEFMKFTVNLLQIPVLLNNLIDVDLGIPVLNNSLMHLDIE